MGDRPGVRHPFQDVVGFALDRERQQSRTIGHLPLRKVALRVRVETGIVYAYHARMHFEVTGDGKGVGLVQGYARPASGGCAASATRL